MKALVTGGAGFLGSHLTELLMQSGYAVRILARPGEDVSWLAKAGAEVCRGDLADRASLEAAVAGVQLLVHCAARMGAWGPWPEYELVNVRGPRVLAEADMTCSMA